MFFKLQINIFLEYCWRLTPKDEVFSYIELIKSKIPSDLCLVLGTLEFIYDDTYTNNAIVLCNSEITIVPKTKILNKEVDDGLLPGINPGVIVLPNFRLGVLVCSDLWEPSLLNKLVLHDNVDIVAVPAWTATIKGNRSNARLDWFSLARTVSTQYSVVVVVADHVYNFTNTDVANATIVFSPDNRRKHFPTSDFIHHDSELIDFLSINLARQRWKNKGLFPLTCG